MANTAFGLNSLVLNTTGSENTAVGGSSLDNNTTGSYNTAVGRVSLFRNKANSRSTALGYFALYGADDREIGRETFNTTVGYGALRTYYTVKKVLQLLV